MKSSVTVKINSFERFAEHCKEHGAALIEEVTNSIEDAVWGEWGWTSIPIKTETSGMGRKMLALVSAGNCGCFHAGFRQCGTVAQPPQPAMTQAAESERSYFIAQAMAIE